MLKWICSHEPDEIDYAKGFSVEQPPPEPTQVVEDVPMPETVGPPEIQFSVDATNELTSNSMLLLNMFELNPVTDWGPPMEVVTPGRTRLLLAPKSQFDCAKEVLTMAIQTQYDIDELRATNIVQKCYQWLRVASVPRVNDLKVIIRMLDLKLGLKLPDSNIRFEHKSPSGDIGPVIVVKWNQFGALHFKGSKHTRVKTDQARKLCANGNQSNH